VIYLIRHFSYTLVLVASLLISIVSFSEEAKPQFVKDYESGYGKYFQVRSEAREKVKLRTIASGDPNAPIKKDEAMEGFKKYLALQKEKQKRRENFDLDKDGKTDCKRKFYPNSSQIKTEVCDFNHDGVVDFKTKYNKDGLAVLELTNFDQDKFFEKKVSCKTITPDKEVAKCVTEIALGSSSTRTLKSTDYMSDFNQALKNRRKKRAERSIASVSGKKDRFDDSKLPSLDGSLDRLHFLVSQFEKEGDSIQAQKVKEKISYIKKMDKDKWVVKGRSKSLSDQSYMKYFSSFDAYYPGDFDSCLHASRDCCQTSINYSKIGAKGNQNDYQHCLNYSFYWCSDNGRNLPKSVNWCSSSKPKTEGEMSPCFECMVENLYEKMTNDLVPFYDEIFESAKSEEAPEGFFSPKYEQVWFHDSCKKYFKEREPFLEVGESCYIDSKGNSSVQANINRMRVARYMEPRSYSFFAKLQNSLSNVKHLNEDDYLDYWKAKKETLDKVCGGDFGCNQYVSEDSPRLKVFCGDVPGSDETGSYVMEEPYAPFKNVNHLFSPPYVVLNTKEADLLGTNANVFKDIEERGMITHGLFHAMGNSHTSTKRLSNGKIRCGWNVEPDYTALCTPEVCQRPRKHGEIWCGMRPGDHLNEEGDLSEEYMDTVYEVYYKHSGVSKEEAFGLVDEFEQCQAN